MVDLSIIVVSFNTRPLLRRCLESIARAGQDVRHELIVVDNASQDGSADFIAVEYPAARLLRSDVNLGFAAAVNLAATHCAGRYLVLINPDATLDRQALERIVDHMDSDPRIAVGGGQLLAADGSRQPSARNFATLRRDIITLTGLQTRLASLSGLASCRGAATDGAAAVDWVPGAFFMVRRAAWERAGGFDQRFFLYFEEMDLCRRLQQMGYSTWYWPDVLVTHVGGASARTLKGMEISVAGAQVTLWRMRSALLYHRKHYGAFGAWSTFAIERAWHALRGWHNARYSQPDRAAKAAESRRINELWRHAWRDTQGGRVAPPAPW